MTSLRVIGIDPGPTPGMVVLDLVGDQLLSADPVQTSARLAPGFLAWLIHGSTGRGIVQVEQFVVGRRATRSSSAHAGAATRMLIGQLEQVSQTALLRPIFLTRSAAAVKPWATDERLERAGLLDLTKGMRHARDAARHALFAAVHDGALPDPMSKEWIR